MDKRINSHLNTVNKSQSIGKCKLNLDISQWNQVPFGVKSHKVDGSKI